jgi:septation ring formation regulator EzrA
VWTGILSLIATILVAVVGFFGINGINDMRRIADEARRIEEVRTSMEKTQAQVEGIRDNITTSLTVASTNLEELRRVADQTLEEQQSAIEDFRSEVARSISTAEVRYSEVQDALEETRTEVRLAAEQVEDLLSDLEILQEALSRAREELEELNNP